jgi:hypothetical protein
MREGARAAKSLTFRPDLTNRSRGNRNNFSVKLAATFPGLSGYYSSALSSFVSRTTFVTIV